MWVLRGLVGAFGPDAIRTWRGWQRDRHDFRVGGREFEIKATLGASARHIINGISQLEPSIGYELYLVSLQLIRSDGGLRLADLVSALGTLCSGSSGHRATFEHACDELGLTDEVLVQLDERFSLRKPPGLVIIDDSFPRITTLVLKAGLPDDLVARIGDLAYAVNAEGLLSSADSELVGRVAPWLRQE
jgi:hypothetical protein